MTSGPSDHPITDVVRVLRRTALSEASEVGDVLRALGRTSHAAVLLATGLVLVSPLSGVPLLSSLCGIVIFLIAGQAALGRDHLWLPARVVRLRVGSARARRVFQGMIGIAAWIDERTDPRLALMVSPTGSRLLFGICAVCGGMTPLLELVPFSSSIVGAGVSTVAAGLLARDGLVAIAGLLLFPLAALLPTLAVVAVL